MTRCIAYRNVIPWEKRCMKKEEETGIKPSYCPFDGDYEKCHLVECVMSYREGLEREGITMIKEDYERIKQANERTIAAIKDSGERREFGTGAVRDMSEGKGLMVVMPAAALLRLSRHYEHGAKKYGKFNWQKGIPVSSFMDSALRHIMKYLDGWDDEDHLSAAAFNILGAMEMEAHKPDMQDIPAREGARPFNYRMEPDEDFSKPGEV